ncbi:uncharacterized protein MYCFIDRAFT_192802 [Pseudocercospora fijiensis CIRAD86]|uniref:Uncharacterized protein n=1 Tax=Pseudocercospora fijiensis (strain CIRAD86) TaxID=383855 RepID=N1QA88_PSEFD|nr:uncharacterized protein MYCFIDRAFT_192802 [Pseudocercospora fijiensis CIRAD86]EME88696.1 hypothetical protein MYCFIDRAFT_192802 [Pseudocercospora fijiensis CIRAD86]
MSNKTDYFTPTPSHNGCPPDCLVPSSSKNPPTPSYNELLRKFLLFCVAVELNVEASLEKEEFLTKKELIHFVELAQFYCGKFQSSNTKNQARERQLRVTITNTAEEMGLDGEEIHARVLPPFWKSTLGQPKGEDEAWKLMTRLETYDYFVPWLTGERIENPLLNQEFKAKIQNGEGEKLEEKLDISIQERMKDAAKEVQLDVKQCIETIHRKSSRGKSDSVTGVIDGKRPGGGIPSPDPGTRLPDLTIALEIVDFMRNHDTANIGRRGEGNSSNKNTEFCSHAKMRAVWEVVSSQHDTRSDRRRTRARALTEKIKARGKRIISRLSWWKPPTPRRLWTNHLERKGGRVKRARGEVERVEAELEYGKAEEEQEVIAE